MKQSPNNGFFGIGIYGPKTESNFGTLWRTALIFNANFIFTIGKKFKRQSSDVHNTWAKIPLYTYENFDQLIENIPYSCRLVGVEISKDAIPIQDFVHPKRAIYLLGNETNGLTSDVQSKCHEIISLPGELSLNVAVAGSIVMYDRFTKSKSDE
ncbi:MAG: rRNA methyltransferase [Chlorobiaceae bacterium]|nr:rRNA methyltransferase [Chlorobiaceae bacterium]MBA4309745.1 rRNA methyltransferase [Chlorobiaceae bacterium]